MIALGADHGGYKLKEKIKEYFNEKNIKYKDFGTYNQERTDYPIYAKKVAESVQNKECDKGILICKSGHGMTIAANKFRGIRAATISNKEEAQLAKSDDDINILTLSGEHILKEQAIEIIESWLNEPFKGGRYKDRLDMIEKIENYNMK